MDGFCILRKSWNKSPMGNTGQLYNNQNERTEVDVTNTDKSHKHHVDQKKSNTKRTYCTILFAKEKAGWN